METTAVSYKTKGYILFDEDELERRKKEFEPDKKKKQAKQRPVNKRLIGIQYVFIRSLHPCS